MYVQAVHRLYFACINLCTLNQRKRRGNQEFRPHEMRSAVHLQILYFYSVYRYSTRFANFPGWNKNSASSKFENATMIFQQFYIHLDFYNSVDKASLFKA